MFVSIDKGLSPCPFLPVIELPPLHWLCSKWYVKLKEPLVAIQKGDHFSLTDFHLTWKKRSRSQTLNEFCSKVVSMQ